MTGNNKNRPKYEGDCNGYIVADNLNLKQISQKWSIVGKTQNPRQEFFFLAK